MHTLMLVKSDVLSDARVRREAEALRAAGHQVTIVGDREPTGPADELPGVEVRWARPGARDTGTVRRRLPHPVVAAARWALLPEHRARQEAAFRAAAGSAVDDLRPDVVHAHDLSALPLGAELASTRGTRLVYDAHECWTGRVLEGRPTPLRNAADRRLEGRLGGQADAVLTVSEGLAHWFHRRYGWADVAVVRNTFPQGQHPPPAGPTALLYAGRIDRKRDLVTAGTVAAELRQAGTPLTVMGAGELTEAGLPDDAPVERLPARPVDGVTAAYREAGLALVSLTDDSLNHRVALPNKLFQAVQAGAPVVAADLPELRRVVGEHGLGALYRPGDPDSLLAAVHAVIDRYDAVTAAVVAARDPLSWERDAEVLLEVYGRLERRRAR